MKSIAKIPVFVTVLLLACASCEFNSVVDDNSAYNNKLMSVEDSVEVVDENYQYGLQVNPNPSADEMTISYFIVAPTFILLNIENLVGDVVSEVANGYWDAGSHSYLVSLKKIGLNKGIYVVHLITSQSSSRILFQYKP